MATLKTNLFFYFIVLWLSSSVATKQWTILWASRERHFLIIFENTVRYVCDQCNRIHSHLQPTISHMHTIQCAAYYNAAERKRNVTHDVSRQQGILEVIINTLHQHVLIYMEHALNVINIWGSADV